MCRVSPVVVSGSNRFTSTRPLPRCSQRFALAADRIPVPDQHRHTGRKEWPPLPLHYYAVARTPPRGKLQSIEKEAMNDDVQARIANITDRLTSVRSYL